MIQRGQERRKPDWKSKLQCFNCGKLGHFKSECRVSKKDRPELTPVKQAIMSANGTELNKAGKGRFGGRFVG